MSRSPLKQEKDEDSAGIRSVSYSNATHSSVLLPTVSHSNFEADPAGQLALLSLLHNKLGIEHRPSDRHELFLTFDLNRSGYITRGEFNHVLIDKYSIYLAKEQMEWLISHFDLDHDGKINYREFLFLLRKLRSGEVEPEPESSSTSGIISGSNISRSSISTNGHNNSRSPYKSPSKPKRSQNTGLLWDYGSDRFNTHDPEKELQIMAKLAKLKEISERQHESFVTKQDARIAKYMDRHHHHQLEQERQDNELIENLNLHSEDPSLLLERFVKEINVQCENGQSSLHKLFKKWDLDQDNCWNKEDVRNALKMTVGEILVSGMSPDLFNSFFATLDIKNDGKVKYFELVNILGSINTEDQHHNVYTHTEELGKGQGMGEGNEGSTLKQIPFPSPNTPTRSQGRSNNSPLSFSNSKFSSPISSSGRDLQQERLEKKVNKELDKLSNLASPIRITPDLIRSPGGSRLPSSSVHIHTSPSSIRKKENITENSASNPSPKSSQGQQQATYSSSSSEHQDRYQTVANIMTDEAIKATTNRIGEALIIDHLPAFKFFSKTLHINLHEEISVTNFILGMSKLNIRLTPAQACCLMLVAKKLSELDRTSTPRKVTKGKGGDDNDQQEDGDEEEDTLRNYFDSMRIREDYNVSITAKDFVKLLSYT